MKIQTPRGRTLLTKVSELIDPLNGEWDEALIRSIFWPVDAERILEIPLYHGREVLVAWHYNRNGLFSVRSAYHLQWENKYTGRLGEQGAGDVERDQFGRVFGNLKCQQRSIYSDGVHSKVLSHAEGC